ncbi:10153_t:CDS:2 [Racocetra persica]|uniref:10153_t:CDS:1 n=1 Tax=Racocetra persica TaxID=160502 RepID=A0ACA9KJJ2_9GLOM|nr:10153_t:CDS:2 [Racocetra persica]
MQKYSESEQAKILSKSVLVANNPEQKNSDDNSEASLSKNSTASIRKNILDHYYFRSLNEEQQKHFEQLILKATVLCSWAFSWVENPEIKTLFEFVHPLIKLPSRKNLSGQILFESTQKITKSIKEIVQNNKNKIILVYDSWKNIKKESIFGSILVTSMGKHKKVLTICQLRSELLHSRNILAIKKSLKTYKQKIGILPKNNEQISLDDNEKELYTSEDNDNINMRQKDDGDYMQYDSFSLNESEGLTNLYDNDSIFQDDIYSADNLAAK